MDNLTHIPRSHIPPADTNGIKVLSILADGEIHQKVELIHVLGDDPRSALQSLRGGTYGYWLIHNIGKKKGVYQLDKRHLQGNSQEDSAARLEREISLKMLSRELAESEIKRLTKAIQAEHEALQRSLF
ncbi:MAG: hypothetical protein V7784_15495 [Oceanospirillaceae bacterium]